MTTQIDTHKLVKERRVNKVIPSKQLSKQASRIKDSIKAAKVFMDGKEIDGVINKITLKDNVIKVFISLTSIDGTISKIEIYDSDGDLLQVQEMQITKNNHYKFMAVVEIAVENEVFEW